MYRVTLLIILGVILNACLANSYAQRDSCLFLVGEPTYDHYYGEKGNPTDYDPVFCENEGINGQ